MRPLLLVGTCALIASTAALGACSSDPDAPPGELTAARALTETDREAIDKNIRGDLGDVVFAYVQCSGLTGSALEACMETAADDGAKVAAGVTPRDFDPLLIKHAYDRVRSMTRAEICTYLPLHSGSRAMYFGYGASYSATPNSLERGNIATGGIELVFDLHERQAAVFAYSGSGIGNYLGGNIAAYQLMGWARTAKTGVVDAWSGTFVAAGASVTIPETAVGISGTHYWSPDGSIVGVAGGFSAGVNVLALFGVDASYVTTEYAEIDALTYTASVMLHGLGIAFPNAIGGAKGQHHISFSASGRYNAAQVEAAAMLGVGGMLKQKPVDDPVLYPELVAALIAVGVHVVDTKYGGVLEDYCAAGVSARALAPRGVGAEPAAPPDTLRDVALQLGQVPAPQLQTSVSDCSNEQELDCDARFPGKNLVCSRMGTFSCCSAPRRASRGCLKDDDCEAAGEVCSKVRNQPDADGYLFGCVKPEVTMCASVVGADCPSDLGRCYQACQAQKPTPESSCFVKCEDVFRACVTP